MSGDGLGAFGGGHGAGGDAGDGAEHWRGTPTRSQPSGYRDGRRLTLTLSQTRSRASTVPHSGFHRRLSAPAPARPGCLFGTPSRPPSPPRFLLCSPSYTSRSLSPRTSATRSRASQPSPSACLSLVPYHCIRLVYILPSRHRPMPASPQLGTRIAHGGHIGTVKFVGPAEGTRGDWLGVEWDDPQRGKHDGVKDGRRYFSCM